MPKMTKSIAKQHFARLRATEILRQSKPGWAVAFGTALVEDGKSSVVIRPKLAQAKTALNDHGIAQAKATNVKNRTSGYAWQEDGKFMLAMHEGQFPNARKAFVAFMKDFQLGATPCAEAELSEDQIALNEQQDDDEDEAAFAEDQDAADIAADIATESEREAAAEPGDPAAEDPAPVEPEPVQEIAQRHVDATDRASRDASDALHKALRRVPGLGDVDEQALAQQMTALMSAKLADLPEDMRDVLIETAPARLFMTLTRDALLGWPERTNTGQILDLYPPDVGVAAREVEDHFVQLSNQLLRRADQDATVSRWKLRDRIEAFVVDGREPAENLDGLQRLSMALLPIMGNLQKLQENFGAHKMVTPDEVGLAALGSVDLLVTMRQAIEQINACRDAHDASVTALEGAGLDADLLGSFDEMRDLLREETMDFVSRLDEAMSGGTSDPATIAALVADAQALLAFVDERFGGSDECDARFSPTRVRAIYADAIGRVTAQAQAVH